VIRVGGASEVIGALGWQTNTSSPLWPGSARPKVTKNWRWTDGLPAAAQRPPRVSLCTGPLRRGKIFDDVV
jgi:hypothetical protein